MALKLDLIVYFNKMSKISLKKSDLLFAITKINIGSY